MSNDPTNSNNPDNEEQSDLFSAEESNATEVAEESAEAPEPAAAGGNGGARQFAPLPALPEGDEVPIAQYAERAYLEYA
ncbi:MAG TPA: hypothetical protein VIM35_03675, partial [Gallionella sp.]